MRVTRAHTGNRRSHHALKEPRLSTCEKCGAAHLRHRMCPECGNYRGRTVVDVAGKKAARIMRRNEKLKAQGVAVAEESEEEEATPKRATAKKSSVKKSAAKKAKEKVTAQTQEDESK